MANAQGFPGCCAIDVIYRLNYVNNGDYLGSSKYRLAVFSSAQKQGYDELRKKFTIVFQSPPFRGNHGRDLVLVLYKMKGK